MPKYLCYIFYLLEQGPSTLTFIDEAVWHNGKNMSSGVSQARFRRPVVELTV